MDENGARANPGWLSISGVNSAGTEYTNWYYVQADGSLLRGGWYEVDGQMRYFDGNGLDMWLRSQGEWVEMIFNW